MPNKHIYVLEWKSMVWINIMLDECEIFNSHLDFLFKDEISLQGGEGGVCRDKVNYICTTMNLVYNVLIIYFMACKCSHNLH